LLTAFNLACTGYGAPDEVINSTATVTVTSGSTPNFSQYQTFTVTNTIQVQDDTSDVPRNYTVDAASIIPRIQANMESRGYTLVPFQQGVRADLVIALYAYLGSQAYGGGYCNWYYWGYPHGCYPTWGYYGTYNFGTFIMQMGDFKNAPSLPPPPGTQVALVWNAAIYQVLGTQNYNLQRVLTSIDQAFAQSPYIHR